MFSRISLRTYCRVLAKPHVGRQSFPQTRSLHSYHRINDINSRIRCSGPLSSYSTVFNNNFIRFASTAEATKVLAENALPQIPEPPTSVEPEIAEIIGEATLKSYGLGGYLPIGLTQHFIYFIQNTCGLPWWATIIMGTAGLKVMLFPLFLQMQKHQALQKFYAKDLSYFERKKKEAANDGDSTRVQMYSMKQDEFYAKHNMMTMTKTLTHYGIQGAVFFTFFMAMNGMARVPIESMREGGILWFSDLTVSDPYCILPLVASISTALYVHFCPPPTIGVKIEGARKYFKYLVPLVTLPFMIFFKSAVMLYIITSTWFTFLFQALVKIPKFRALCKLPPIIKMNEDTTLSSPLGMSSAMTGIIKEAWRDIRHNRATNKAHSLDVRQFESAGRGPVVKTYKYDPTKEIPKARRY